MTALPALAKKSRTASGVDDPAKPLLGDVPDLIDKFNDMRSYLDGLFGSDGVPATARQILGVPEGSGIWPTGRGRITFSLDAAPGFILADDGTIGNTGSGATTRANADTNALYVLLYDSQPNLAVSGGRGASALDDFNVNKTLEIPRMLGRAIAVNGLGSGLTIPRSLGELAGEEAHMLTDAELAAHGHNYSFRGGGYSAGFNNNGTLWWRFSTATTGSVGSDALHNITQPTIFMNFEIAL